MVESVFRNKFIKKEALALAFSYEYCKVFNNTYFTIHFQMAASTVESL